MNGKIIIENYELVGCHGVNLEEKVNPQRFLFSAILDLNITSAAEDDDISKTISYAAVCKLIKAFFEEKSKDLLETLALGIAQKIMINFPQISCAEVTVKKPDAPMKGTFENVGVCASVKRSKAYLSLGSSIGDRDVYLNKAIEFLKADDLIISIKESRRIETEPYGGVAENIFLNSAIYVETLHTPESLLKLVNDIEDKCGRTRDVHWEDRTLDIDILLFDDEIRSEFDLIIPHPEMLKRDFVMKPLVEIAPYVVHPIASKTVSQLVEEMDCEP